MRDNRWQHEVFKITLKSVHIIDHSRRVTEHLSAHKTLSCCIERRQNKTKQKESSFGTGQRDNHAAPPKQCRDSTICAALSWQEQDMQSL